jgi:hypothetical protein
LYVLWKSVKIQKYTYMYKNFECNKIAGTLQTEQSVWLVTRYVGRGVEAHLTSLHLDSIKTEDLCRIGAWGPFLKALGRNFCRRRKCA